MAKSSTPLQVRMPPAERAWLEHTAAANNRSQNAELLRLLADAMKVEPLRIFVREVAFYGLPTTFTVSIGEFGDELIDTVDRDEALAFARDKIAELGLPKTALTLNRVADKAA